MKSRGVRRIRRAGVTSAIRRATRTDRRPPVASRTHVAGDPTMCERCGAVYERKTWRAAGRSRSTPLVGLHWTLCPACTQVADQEYFGRVRITTPLPAERETEVRRRVWNVERRARHTQPQRRTVRIDREAEGLEILTTSQKLAHRIARELEKAFGGRTHYAWSDRGGMLDATWAPPGGPPEARATRSEHARRPRLERRALR